MHRQPNGTPTILPPKVSRGPGGTRRGGLEHRETLRRHKEHQREVHGGGSRILRARRDVGRVGRGRRACVQCFLKIVVFNTFLLE